MFMPLKFMFKDILYNNEIMFDGSTISGFRDNETLDLRLFPDKSTFLQKLNF